MSTSVNDRDSLAELERAVRKVRRRIVEACGRANRDPGTVRLIAVTKHVGDDVIRAAAGLGIEEFGENYVQELARKRAAAPDATWHFIGRLQRNKARRVLEDADMIETLEPGHATDRLLDLARGEGRPEPADVLIEVDFTGRRVGVAPADLAAFADRVGDAPGLTLRGLMTVAPAGEDPRPWFRRLRELGEDVRRRHRQATELSMGMSTDLEVAIDEGATMVRVGTAIFGPRTRR